jgi:gliding motility-associated-like protein
MFKPVGINLKRYHVMLFDVWGHLLWESTLLDSRGRPEEGWDGKFEGNPMPMGTYMWKVEATFIDDTPWNGNDIGKSDISTIGTVSLIR